MSSGKVIPALLTLGDHYGSLAATRSLGSKGIPVVFAEHRRGTVAQTSRFVTRHEVCPPASDLSAMAEWLIAFGQKNGPHFLYPTNDDMAWIITRHASRLEKYFRMWRPSFHATESLLNKEFLSQASVEVGLPVPNSAFPKSADEAIASADQLGWPLLLKPKTQMGFLSKAKGVICHDADDVRRNWQLWQGDVKYHQEIYTHSVNGTYPIAQEFLKHTAHDTFSIGGFVDAERGQIVALSSRKVFQRPRRLGVGIAFESEPMDDKFKWQVLKLCQLVKYSGVFEAEFLASNTKGQYVLADFNPRFYGQMAFEVARGLDLPHFAYIAACASESQLAEVFAARSLNIAKCKYSNSSNLKLMIRAQRLAGKLTAEEFSYWTRWLRQIDVQHFEAVDDASDPRPGLTERRMLWKHACRHPRDFLRKYFLES